jgi:hypothetical protein
MNQTKHWRTRTEQWLSDDRFDRETTDEAFALVFTAMAAVEPSEDFARRAVRRAFLARARRRRVAMSLAIAAGVSLTAVAAGVWVYGLSGISNPETLFSTLASVAASSTVSLLIAVSTSVEWWASMTGAGSGIATAVATPQNVGALLLLEVAAGVALYALYRLLRADVEFRDPGPLCL